MPLPYIALSDWTVPVPPTCLNPKSRFSDIMATSRASALYLSQTLATIGRPCLHLSVRCVANVRPLLKSTTLGCAKYSTAVPGRPSLAPKIERGSSKLFKNADEAVSDLKSGSTILSSGFGLCGVAGMPTQSLAEKIDN